MKDVSGEYLLRGQMEMASGFLLKADNSFQFFFSYGALDRYAKGHWLQKGTGIILNSAEQPGNDFSLVSSREIPGNKTRIRVDHSNPLLLSSVLVNIDAGRQGAWKQMNQRGELLIEGRPTGSVAVLFEFCPERISHLPVPKDHNEIVLRPQPWLFEVFLNNFYLDIGEEELCGAHPLLEGNSFRYTKTQATAG